MTGKNLILFHIGPVQEFIASGRRSRDFWFGSRMLSELSKAVCIRIEEETESEALIYPYLPPKENRSELDKASFPNHILVQTSFPQADLAKKAGEAIHARLAELRKDALARVKGEYAEKVATQQIENLPEFYWVSVPLIEDYKASREMAEALLAARKTTRDFKQVQGTQAYKSSLDGARESVIPEDQYVKRFDLEETRKKKTRKLYENYHARRGEQLSGVDLLKRLGDPKNEPDFKSTSHVAATPFMEALGTTRIDELIREIIKIYGEFGWKVDELDRGALLYENRVSEWVSETKDQREIRKKIDGVIGKPKPSPYYALLAADGDNMGRLIDEQKSPQVHRELSKALSDFARRVPSLVEAHSGFPVYSGGDDVLAYLPLHRVLPCAENLEAEFKKKLSPFAVHKNDEFISATLSIGIVIAHHLEPLTEIVKMARDAEHEAKKLEGKNGLAVTLSKRGGVDRTVKGKFASLLSRLKELRGFIDAGAISASAAYELRDLYRRLHNVIPHEGLAGEAKRIIGRKNEAGGGAQAQDDAKQALIQWLMGGQDDPASTSGPVPIVPLDELANEMIVARMLAVETDFGALRDSRPVEGSK